MKRLVSKDVEARVEHFLSLARAMEKMGFKKEACAVFVKIGKMLPGKVCIKSFGPGGVKFFLPVPEPVVPGWAEAFMAGRSGAEFA